MPNFPSLKMRSFGHSLKGKRQKVPHFLLLFFCKNQSNLSSFFVRTGALQTLRSLQMLRSATNAPELYKSSGGLKIPLQRLRLLLGSAPLRGAKILNAPLQRSGRSVKCLMLRSGALHNTDNQNKVWEASKYYNP